MRLIADETRVQYGVVSDLALQRKHVLLGVRNAIADRIRRDAADGNVLRPVECGIGMAGRTVQRRKGHREVLAEILLIGSSNEWIGKSRRSGARVRGSVRSVGRENSDGERFDGCVVEAETGAKTGLRGTAKNL